MSEEKPGRVAKFVNSFTRRRERKEAAKRETPKVQNLVALRLRELADDIDAGRHGQVESAVLVIDGAGIDVVTIGAPHGMTGPHGVLLLNAGIARVANAVLAAKASAQGQQ